MRHAVMTPQALSYAPRMQQGSFYANLNLALNTNRAKLTTSCFNSHSYDSGVHTALCNNSNTRGAVPTGAAPRSLILLTNHRLPVLYIVLYLCC